MAIIKKLLMCTPREAMIKIKSDKGGGTIEVALDELCYRPTKNACDFNKEEKNKFCDFVEGVSTVNPTCMIWAGHTQDGHGRIYRGSKDLEHEFTSFCVGDTCQLDMQGDDTTADNEYGTEKFIFELESEVTLWLRVHKLNYRNYNEIASFGVYDDTEKLGLRVQ